MRTDTPEVPPPPVLYLSTPRAARIRGRITPSGLASIPPPSLKAVPVAGGSALPRREHGPREAPRPSRARSCVPWGSAAGAPRAGPEGLLLSKLKRKDISFLFFIRHLLSNGFGGVARHSGPAPPGQSRRETRCRPRPAGSLQPIGVRDGGARTGEGACARRGSDSVAWPRRRSARGGGGERDQCLV